MASLFGAGPAGSAMARRRTGGPGRGRPGLEALEPRTLLASSLTFTDGDGDRFLLRVVNGGSVGAADANHDGRAEIGLAQTGPTSELHVTTVQVGAAGDGLLHVESIVVATRLLRALRGRDALDLQGPMTPLSGDLAVLDLRSLGPGAVVDVQRDLGRLDVAGDVTFDLSSRLVVGRDLGWADIDGDLALNGGRWQVGRDMTTVLVVGDIRLFPAAPPGGPPAIAAAALPSGPLAGSLQVARDVGFLQVGGDLTLGPGSLIVQRDLKYVSILGDVDSSDTGMIAVGRRLDTLLVGGDWIGTGPDDDGGGGGGGEALVAAPAAGPGGLDLVVGGSPQVGTVGLLKVTGQIAGVAMFAGSQVGSLMFGRGVQDSVLCAGAIGSMIVGSGPRGAIVDSEIVAAGRIDAAIVDGDIVGSRIVANPLTTVGLPGGPVLAGARFTTRFRVRQVQVNVVVNGQVQVRLAAVTVADLLTETTLPASLGGQIGSAATPFQLRGNLVDSLLAANWSPGQDGLFNAPAAPRSLARTAASGDDGVGRGSIALRLAAGFRAVDSGSGPNATGLYARTVVLAPGGTMVEPP